MTKRERKIRNRCHKKLREWNKILEENTNGRWGFDFVKCRWYDYHDDSRCPRLYLVMLMPVCREDPSIKFPRPTPWFNEFQIESNSFVRDINNMINEMREMYDCEQEGCELGYCIFHQCNVSRKKYYTKCYCRRNGVRQCRYFVKLEKKLKG